MHSDATQGSGGWLVNVRCAIQQVVHTLCCWGLLGILGPSALTFKFERMSGSNGFVLEARP